MELTKIFFDMPGLQGSVSYSFQQHVDLFSSFCLMFHWSLVLLPVHSLFFGSSFHGIFSRLRKGKAACFWKCESGKQRLFFPALLNDVRLLTHWSAI